MKFPQNKKNWTAPILAKEIMTTPPFMQAGYVYAPYIPMQVTPVFEINWTVPEYYSSDVFPWKVGNVVKYLENIWLVLEVKFKEKRGYWFRIKAIDHEGKTVSLTTSSDMVLRNVPIEVLYEAP